MNLREASELLFRTHVAALDAGTRARAYEMKSGPGIGKSSVAEQVCIRMALDRRQPVGFVVAMLANMSGPDVMGFMLPTKQPDGQLLSIFSVSPLMPNRFNMIVFEPKPDGSVVRWEMGTWEGPIPTVGNVFLDEFGQGEADVQKPAAEFLLNGRIGSNILPVGWRVIAASNRMSDRSGVVRQLMHVVNRRGEMLITGDYRTWHQDFVLKLPDAQRPHFMTVSFAEKQPHIVFPNDTPGDGAPYCTPRSLIAMDAELRSLRTDEHYRRDTLPTDDLSRELMVSWIGEGPAAQFNTHLKYSEVIPTYQEVVDEPTRAKLPKAIDAQMVVTHMLSHSIEAKHSDPVMRYLERLDIEMQVACLRAVLIQTGKAAQVLTTARVQAWMVKHRDLIMASAS